MKSNIIPIGPSEIITSGSLTREAMVLTAETELVITNLIYCHPATPANPAGVDALTIQPGRELFLVKSCDFTGTASVIYLR